MSIETLKWVIIFAVPMSLTFLAYVFFSGFSNVAEDFHREHRAEGDTTLADLYISLSPEMFFFCRVACFIVLFLIGAMVSGPVIGALLGFPGFFIPLLVLNMLKAKRVKRIERQLVEGLELMGNSLKSGLTLPQAVDLLVKEFPPPISQEFALVMAETRLGVEFTDALHNMAVRLKSNIVFILAAGVSVTKRCGGDLTVIFSNIAAVIREQANIEGKLDAVTAQGRFQGLILGAMPFVLMVVLYFIDRNHVETLFTFTLGHWAIASVVVMVLLAQLWIRKLMQIDV